MCGRYKRRGDKQKIAEAFALGNVGGLPLELDLDLELAPNYNVAPQTVQPVICVRQNMGHAQVIHDVLEIPSFARYRPEEVQT
jgi:putative SOS response-associated peptidase YedK